MLSKSNLQCDSVFLNAVYSSFRCLPTVSNNPSQSIDPMVEECAKYK